MGIPNPRTEIIEAAPAGMVRVVAWRQHTPTWPHPDLVPIHTDRAALLHWWADTYHLEVDDWGVTDAERPSEYVQLLLESGQAALAAGLGALATGYVKRFFEQRRPQAAKKAGSDQTDEAPPPPDVRPLLALTIVNQSGGTVVVLDAATSDEAARSVARVMNPKWRGQELVS